MHKIPNKLKGSIDNSTIIVGHVNSALSIANRIILQKLLMSEPKISQEKKNYRPILLININKQNTPKKILAI